MIPKKVDAIIPQIRSIIEKVRAFLKLNSPVTNGFFLDLFNLSSFISKQSFIEKAKPKYRIIIKKNTRISIKEWTKPLKIIKLNVAIKRYGSQFLIRKKVRYDFI